MSFLQSLFGARPDYTAQVRDALAAGGRIVDVRQPHEFAGGHVPGALNIPHDAIAAGAKQLGAPTKPVILYCRSGARSSMAARTLKGLGFTTVIDVGSMSRFPRAALGE